MIKFRQYIEEEGVAANAVGGGNVAGLGVGAQGEPGVSKHRMKKIKDQAAPKRRLIGFGYAK